MSIRPLSFTKSKRLLNSSDFKGVFSNTQYRVSHRYFLILAIESKASTPRLGLVIAKKHIRFAVERNRIKRLIRESFRQQQHQLPTIDAIVLARKGLDKLSNSKIEITLNELWQKTQKKVRNSASVTGQPPQSQ